MSSDFMAVSLTLAPCTLRMDLKRVIKNTHENLKKMGEITIGSSAVKIITFGDYLEF